MFNVIVSAALAAGQCPGGVCPLPKAAPATVPGTTAPAPATPPSTAPAPAAGIRVYPLSVPTPMPVPANLPKWVPAQPVKAGPVRRLVRRCR